MIREKNMYDKIKTIRDNIKNLINDHNWNCLLFRNAVIDIASLELEKIGLHNIAKQLNSIYDMIVPMEQLKFLSEGYSPITTLTAILNRNERNNTMKKIDILEEDIIEMKSILCEMKNEHSDLIKPLMAAFSIDTLDDIDQEKEHLASPDAYLGVYHLIKKFDEECGPYYEIDQFAGSKLYFLSEPDRSTDIEIFNTEKQIRIIKLYIYDLREDAMIVAKDVIDSCIEELTPPYFTYIYVNDNEVDTRTIQ